MSERQKSEQGIKSGGSWSPVKEAIITGFLIASACFIASFSLFFGAGLAIKVLN